MNVDRSSPIANALSLWVILANAHFCLSSKDRLWLEPPPPTSNSKPD